MMTVFHASGCCGVREIHGLSEYSTSSAAMKAFYKAAILANVIKFRYVYFAQNGPHYGDKFAAYILENKLGEIIETGSHVNPNSGNKLKMFVWTLNIENLKAWAVGNMKPVEPLVAVNTAMSTTGAIR